MALVRALAAAWLLASALAPAAQTPSGTRGVQDPAWSPDGRRLAFSYLDQIWIAAADGRNGRPLRPESLAVERDPAWSPDGETIAFAADAGDGFRITLSSADGGAATTIPSPAPARWPSWTRDGRVIFSQRDHDRWRLYAAPRDGPAAAPLFAGTPADDERQGSVSPDGSRIAYISDRDSQDGDVDLWVADLPAAAAGGTRRTRLVRARGLEASPTWSPDGSRIAFFAAREGIGAVWVADADPAARPAQGPVLVSRHGGTPAWAPDGKRLAIAEVPPGEPAYNGNPRRNDNVPPPLFADAFRLWFVDAPAPVDAGARTVAAPDPPPARFAAAFDRVWETLRRLYYADGAGAASWSALRGRYRPQAEGARDEAALERTIDAMIAEQPLIKPAVSSSRAVVVSGHPLASRAGAEVLEKGGNIVDAAIAVSFALGVVEPDASGIGGDGMAVLYLAGMPEPVAIDFKDQTPMRATRDHPLLQRAQADGPAAANIPGVVAGMELLYSRYGSRKVAWAELIAPAIDYAEQGYVLDNALPTTIEEGRRLFARHEAARRIYLPDGRAPRAGDRFFNRDYGATLRTIASEGAAAFYRGAIARRIAADMAANGGLLTLDDLAQYRAIERKPLEGRYRGHAVYAAPPPVSTGAALIETLQILENYSPAPGTSYARDADFLHYAIESWKVRDTQPRIADPGLWDGQLGPHLDPAHAAALFRRIDRSRASRAGSGQDTAPAERIGRGTTAFAIADVSGNMIAVTQTLSTWGGTFYVSPGLGFLYNNHLRFAAGAAPGRFLPLARSTSTSAPTLVFERAGADARPGTPLLAAAAAGNSWIPAAVYDIVLHVIDAGMPAQAAVEAPRFLVARDPADPSAMRIQHEDRIPRGILDDLAARGHRFQKIGRKGEVRYGYAAAVVVDAARREVHGGADPRRSHASAAPGR